MVISIKQMDCTAPTLEIGKVLVRREKIHFPKIPPTAAPRAKGKAVLELILFVLLILLLITEYVVMDKTVHPERKLMVLTSIIWKASRTGLIITPPPIPQIAPITDAKKQIRKNKIINLSLIHI